MKFLILLYVIELMHKMVLCSVKHSDEGVKKRPTKCHTCRVVVQELVFLMEQTKYVKQPKTNIKQPKTNINKVAHKHSKSRIINILEFVCNKVYNYGYVEGPEFPYLRGVNLDPYNRELDRMFLKCELIVEQYEDDIMNWYMQRQEEDPMTVICAEIVLKPNEKTCLNATASTGVNEEL